MGENFYKIFVNDELICEKARVENALLIVQAVAEKYYADPSLIIILQRMSKDEDGTWR